MPQAKVTTNAVPGSNVLLPINTLVQLDNQNSGGELTYTWSILDQPPGPVNALSSTSVQNPFFTPTKEGTYLIRLVVNQGLPTEQEDRVVCGIRQVKTLERIPAAGETTEADTSDGWATASNSYLRRIDALLSDPGVIVGVNASGSTLSRGQVLRATAASVIKSGLPGQETVPGFSVALSNVLAQIDELLVVMEGNVDGTPNAAAGQLIRVRYIGRLAAVTPGGTAAVGDTVFINDTGNLSLTQGTIRRRVGSAMSAGTTFDVWFNGVGGADVDLTPIDRRYLVYGSKGTLPNAFRVDGVTNSDLAVVAGDSFVIKTGDATTITMVLRRFSGSGLALQQWQTEGGTVLAQVLNSGQLSLAQGLVVTGGGANINSGDLVFAADNQLVTWGGGYSLTKVGTTMFVRNGTGNGVAGFSGSPTQASFGLSQISVGNSVSLVVTATESQLSSTALSLPIWVGPNNNWNFDTDGGFKARSTNNQRVQWPSLFNVSSRGGGVTLGRDAANFAEFATDPTNTFSFLTLFSGAQGGQLYLDAASLKLRTTTNVPVDLGVNNTTLWRVTAAGQLQAQGGNRAIQNVLDPVASQDAATKNSSLALAASSPTQNNAINGNFEYWQRGTTEVTNVRTSVGMSIATYRADRWGLNVNVTTANGQSVTGGVQRVAATTGRGNFAARIRAVSFTGSPTPATICNIGLNQEIDRRFVEQLRGRRVGVRLLMRKGSTISDQFGQVVLTANTGLEIESVRSYTAPSVLMNEQFDISAMFGSFTPYRFVAAVDVPANATGLSLRISRDCQTNLSSFNANDYIDVAEVLLVALPAGATNPSLDVPNDFWLAGRTSPSEFALCESYFEKSYDRETAVGIAAPSSGLHSVISIGAGGNLVLCPGLQRRQRSRLISGSNALGGFTVYSAFNGASGQVFNAASGVNQAVAITAADEMAAGLDVVAGSISQQCRFHYSYESEFA